jgi:cytochrome c oxidase subunit II
VDPARLISTTEAIDPVFIYIFGACLVLLVGITAAVIVFVVRYHRSRAPEPTSRADGNLWLEIIWTVLPTLLVMAMFWYGWKEYLVLRTVPKGAMEVTATARMWSWNFSYADGRSSSKLYVPVGRPVRVRLVSQDVIHGFFLPAFRVKRDVVPGMENYAWFVADKPGSYDLFCSQYCGTNHSAMITTVEALPEEKFKAWQQQGNQAGAQAGHELLEKHGCLGCHSLDGSPKVGPTLKGIWGRSVAVVSSGTEHTLTVDAAYLKRSLLEPNADLVKGFPPVMPSFKGQMTDAEIDAVIVSLQGGGTAPAKVDGRNLAQEKGCLGCHSLDGSPGVGPSFKGIMGRREIVVTGGKERPITVDDAYLKRSILDPHADLVKGFQAIMPAYGDVKPEELDALVEFLEGQK